MTSAHTIDETTMKALHAFNMNFKKDVSSSSNRKQKAEDPTMWAGRDIRIMLHLIYTVSMLCLLRFDKTLRIRWQDIEFGIDEFGVDFVKLKLPFRKTHQNGGTC